MGKRNIANIVTLCLVCLVLIVGFQNCTESHLRFHPEGSSSNKYMGGSTGHGSGYDGKLDPGLFVHQDPEHLCRLGDGTETRVKSMIRIHPLSGIHYFDSCREENPQPVDERELTFLDGSVLVFKGQAFGREKLVPTLLDPSPILSGTCIFPNLEEGNFDGAVVSAQVSVYNDLNSNNLNVRVFYIQVQGFLLQSAVLPDRVADSFVNSTSALQLTVGISPVELDVSTPTKTTGVTDLFMKVVGRSAPVAGTAKDVCNFNSLTN